MVDARIRVEGIAQAQRGLSRLMGDLQDMRVFHDIAETASRVAVSFTPRRSGALAASVRPAAARNRATVTAGSARVPYAGVQNYGWPARGIPAVDFLARTDDVMRHRAPDQLQRAVDRLLAQGGMS